jgi:hypothetical protein
MDFYNAVVLKGGWQSPQKDKSANPFRRKEAQVTQPL